MQRNTRSESEQGCMYLTVSGSTVSAAIAPAPRALQWSRQVIGLVLGVPSSVCKPRRATRNKNDLAVLVQHPCRHSASTGTPRSSATPAHVPATHSGLQDDSAYHQKSFQPPWQDAEQTRPSTRYQRTHQSPRLVTVTAPSLRVPWRPATRTLATGRVFQSPDMTSQQPAHFPAKPQHA